MATRSGNLRFSTEDGSGLVTISEPPALRERLAVGERLERALAEVDDRQSGETQRHAERRQQLADAIRETTDERNGLLERAKELETKALVLREQLEALPDEASGRAQRITDRLAALTRTLKAEVHLVNEMLDAYAAYRESYCRWEEDLAASPELAQSRKLVDFHDANPNAIADLPDVIRSIVEQSLADARAELDGRGEPERPAVVAPIYECVTPSSEGGSVVALVIPGSCEALKADSRQAPLVAEVLAAMSQALIELTDSDAPILICADGQDAISGAVVVGAPCGTDALDADLFGVRVQELLAESRLVGIELLPIYDVDLAFGIGEFVRERSER